MKVSEVIEKLKEMPPDATAYFHDDSMMREVTEIKLIDTEFFEYEHELDKVLIW